MIHSKPNPVRWTFDAQGPVRSTPVIVGDVLYLTSDGGYLFALDKGSGALKWKFKTDAAVASTPLVEGGFVYLTTKKGTLYAIDAKKRKAAWTYSTKVTSRYTGGWDYFISAPVSVGKRVIFGSGDHHIYALDKKKGTVAWKYDTGDMVRATPTVVNGVLYCGTMKGQLLALSVKKGKLKWTFKAAGNKYFPKGEFLFKPVVYENTVYAGSRDASFYAVDAQKGTLRWKVTDKKGAWYTRAIAAEGVIFAASSDGHYIQALEPGTGKEKWVFHSDHLVFSTPARYENTIYFGGHDNYIYAVDARTGSLLWRFRTGNDVLGSPLVQEGVLYIGGDDGKLYALDARPAQTSRKAGFHAVYYAPQLDKKVRYLTTPMPRKIYEIFRDAGYHRLDAPGLEAYLAERIKNKQAGSTVIVLASFTYPYSILQAAGEAPAPVRQYLDGGGTFVWIGNMPQLALVLKKEGETEKVASAAKETMAALGVDQSFVYGAAFYYDSYIAHSTEAGKKRGLPGWFSSGYGVDPKLVTTVLALDEHGRAPTWIKNYGGPEGTGLIRIWAGEQLPESMEFILNAAKGNH
jgi:outer membrane protein assembly factor BamB